MKNTAFILLLLLTAAPAFTESWTVNYIEGHAYSLGQDGWAEIFVGDVLDAGAKVKILPESVIELSAGSEDIIISKAGTYSISSIVSEKRTVAGWDLATLVSGKIDILFSGKSTTDGEAVMGVRDLDAGEEIMEYMEEDQELFLDGLNLINKKEYKNALEHFLTALGSVEDKERCSFYIGYLYSLENNNTESLVYLNRVTPDPETDYFPELTLLKGRLLMESLSFYQALQVFKTYLKVYQNGSEAQLVYYLSALCYQGMGEKRQMRNQLEQTVKINPQSELGMKAADLLK